MMNRLFYVLIILNCWNLKVTEMKAEYFPPKEDVILQNEAPTDFYIFVTGEGVRNYTIFNFIYSN